MMINLLVRVEIHLAGPVFSYHTQQSEKTSGASHPDLISLCLFNLTLKKTNFQGSKWADL